jgi:hypothetical protein
VIWSSGKSGVFGIAPNSVWNGLRGWKSIGPFLAIMVSISVVGFDSRAQATPPRR